jgi:CHAT domain-containing protein/tetratricopeptide (TPR) repeat protein
MDSWRELGILPGACLVTLAACSGGLSPVESILRPTKIEVAGRQHQDLAIEAPADAHVLVTVQSPGIDVRGALVGASGDIHNLPVNAPNKRMGVELLLLEPPHEPRFAIRIEGHDHGAARGLVTVEAIVLPASSAADRRRLEAVRLESNAGRQFGDLTKGEATAAAYAAAADLHDRNGDDRRAGLALLHAAGARYTRLADWRGAADLAAQAERLLSRANAPALAAFGMRLEGAALAQLADAGDTAPAARRPIIERARQRLTEAAKRFEELDLAYEAGYAYNYRGVSYQDAGERDQARADFQRALDLFRSAHDKPAQALSLQSLATLSHEEGRLTDALREFDAALALIPRDEEPENYAHTLNNSARPLQVLGRFDEAIERYYEAGQILHQLGDRGGEARALHGMGTTLWHAGEPQRAKEFLRSAIDLRSATGAGREMALALIVLGQIERSEGNVGTAIALHKQAAALASAPSEHAIALLALAQDAIAAEDFSTARRELDALLRLGLPATHRYLGMAMTDLGALEAREGNAAAAIHAFDRAIAIHRTNGSELEEAQALYRRAEAFMRAGNMPGVLADTENALRLFDAIGLQGTQAESRATFRASYRGAVELRIAALLADAKTAEAQGDAKQAQQLLRAALEASDRSRALLLTEVPGGAPAHVLARRAEIYELLAGKRQLQERLLDAAVPDTAQLAALGKEIALLRTEARLLESRLAKLQSTSRRAFAPHDAAGLTEAISPDVLVAEYFLGESRSWLFEVRDGVVAVYPLPRPAEIEALARRLHISWRSAARTSGGRLAMSRTLAGLLLGPLGKSRPAGEFRIIPDGALHLVPMGLLAQQNWPGMRSGTAVVVPALFVQDAGLGAQHTKPAKSLAVIADPVYTADDPRIQATVNRPAASARIRLAGDAPLTRSARDQLSLQRLPSTGVEAREIVDLVNDPSKTLVLIGPDASRVRVTTAPLDEYRILHFATHALADSQDPALATLALSRWDDAGNPIDGSLRLYDITQMRLNADLVVLSGCDTSLGREIAGEGPIGLSQAFLRSGAKSVIATLWQVPDTSTALLMREFYRHLLGNQRDAATALQLAQDHIRRQAKWSDPYFWAGFQLISKTRMERNVNDVE